MTIRITAYLCSIKAPGIEFIPPEKGSSISGNRIIMYMEPEILPEDCEKDVLRIEASMIPEDPGHMFCLDRHQSEISWEYEEAFSGYPIINIKHVEDCRWRSTHLKLIGPERCGLAGEDYIIFYPGDGGQIPENKDDVLHAPKESDKAVTQNTIVPGMKLQLVHNYDGVPGILDTEPIYWCTTCISGGTVELVEGEYGSTDISYKVNVCGETVTCLPTDFVEYAVGDWVFVIKQGEGGDARDTDCSSDGTYFIAPLKVYEDGA